MSNKLTINIIVIVELLFKRQDAKQIKSKLIMIQTVTSSPCWRRIDNIIQAVSLIPEEVIMTSPKARVCVLSHLIG